LIPVALFILAVAVAVGLALMLRPDEVAPGP